MGAEAWSADDLAYLVTVGNGRFHYIARGAIEALRQAGDFRGRIVLLSDRDIDTEQDCQVIRVRDPALLAEPKLIKLHLADFLHPADFRRVLFLDADVAVRAPFADKVAGLISGGALVCTDDSGQTVDRGLCARLLDTDERVLHAGRSLGVNSGFFVGAGAHMSEWLAEWKALLDANRHRRGDGFDQPVLNAAMLRGLLPVCVIRGMMWFPRLDPDRLTCGTHAPLVHFNGAGRKWRRAWQMQRFVRRSLAAHAKTADA